MRQFAMVAAIAGCGTPRLPDDVAWIAPFPSGAFGFQLATIEADVVAFRGPGEGVPTGLVRIAGADGHQEWSVDLAQPSSSYDRLVVTNGWIVVVRGEGNDVAIDRYDPTGTYSGTEPWTGLPSMEGCLSSFAGFAVAASANTVAVAACNAYQQGLPTDTSPPVHALAISPSTMAALDDRIAIGGPAIELVDDSGEHAILGESASALKFAADGDLIVALATGVSRLSPSGDTRWKAPITIEGSPQLAFAASGDVLYGDGAFYDIASSNNQGRVIDLAGDSGDLVSNDSIYGAVIGLATPGPAVALVEDPATAFVALETR